MLKRIRTNEFGSMTARKGDICKATILQITRPHMARQDHTRPHNIIKGHIRPYKATQCHTRP